jgi:phosphoglycolate phosphatase
MLTPFNVVAFDLDGTLADTAPDLAASLNHALVRLGRPEVPEEQVRHLIGHGARALLRRGLAASGEASEELVEAGYPFFIDYYLDHICVGTRPYPGVEATLETLTAQGIRVAVCTNKAEAITFALFDALGWRDRFDAVVGGDTLKVRKPDPAPLFETIARAGGGRAVLVGDSITDADTAKAAGVPFVAVSFGFSDRPVAALGAQAIIDDYAELAGALAVLSGWARTIPAFRSLL